MMEISLTQGKKALVDDEDYEKLSKFRWCFDISSGNPYAKRYKNIRMHRFLMNFPKGKEIDHIDGNGLNNQRKNLRICDHLQNVRNRKKNKNNVSGFKGVGWNKKIEKWRAYIRFNGVLNHLGYFNDKLKAYQAYCDACLKYHGEFSRLK